MPPLPDIKAFHPENPFRLFHLKLSGPFRTDFHLIAPTPFPHSTTLFGFDQIPPPFRHAIPTAVSFSTTEITISAPFSRIAQPRHIFTTFF